MARKSDHRTCVLFSAFLERRPRKGQWFLIAGLTLISMMTLVVLSRTQIQIGQSSEPWQKYMFDNIKTETPSAINAIIYENATSKNIEERSRDYLDFLQTFGDAHNANISAYFIIGIPAGSGMNVSIINFDQTDMHNVSVALDSTIKTIDIVHDRNSTTLAFSDVPDYFQVNYSLTEVNATGWKTPENSSFSTTKRTFFATKLRVESKDESQIWQKIEWY